MVPAKRACPTSSNSSENKELQVLDKVRSLHKYLEENSDFYSTSADYIYFLSERTTTSTSYQRSVQQQRQPLEIGDVVNFNKNDEVAVVMATTNNQDGYLREASHNAMITAYYADTFSNKYVEVIHGRESEFRKLNVLFQWPPVSTVLEFPEHARRVTEKIGKDSCCALNKSDSKKAKELTNELRAALLDPPRRKQALRRLKNRLGVCLDLNVLCPSLLALLRAERDAMQQKGASAFDKSAFKTLPQRYTYGWCCDDNEYSLEGLDGKFALRSKYNGNNGSNICARCPSSRIRIVAKVLEVIFSEFGYMATAPINNVQVLRYLRQHALSPHHDNCPGSEEWRYRGKNGQRYGTPTITASLGDDMTFHLQAGEKLAAGRGLRESTGIAEHFTIKDGQMLLLDPLTDNAIEHHVKWPRATSASAETVERWVFAFRNAGWVDYFDVETGVVASTVTK